MSYEPYAILAIGAINVITLLAYKTYRDKQDDKRYDPLRYLDYAIGVLSHDGQPKVDCKKAVARLKRHRTKIMEQK